MQASSVNGISAGRIAADKYGFVHEADIDGGALSDSISRTAAMADPSGAGIVLPMATVELDGARLSEVDAARALLFTINKFSHSHCDFTISELTDGYQQMLDHTRDRIVVFKRTIAAGDFEAAFQPIVNMRSRALHHYKALARFPSGGADTSPYENITFAEEVGVIGDFDIAMCRKVIGNIHAARDAGQILNAAVNLSGKSLESPAFVEELLRTVRDYRAIRNHLMFEVTESSRIDDLESTNKVLAKLHKLGHHVCLDDFGAGAAAFQYLRALEVDLVKIDGIYVREAFTTPNGKVFLTSMASLCKDLKIQTVAEFVETEEVARFLLRAGVTWARATCSADRDRSDQRRQYPPDRLVPMAPSSGGSATRWNHHGTGPIRRPAHAMAGRAGASPPGGSAQNARTPPRGLDSDSQRAFSRRISWVGEGPP